MRKKIAILKFLEVLKRKFHYLTRQSVDTGSGFDAIQIEYLKPDCSTIALLDIKKQFT